MSVGWPGAVRDDATAAGVLLDPGRSYEERVAVVHYATLLQDRDPEFAARLRRRWARIGDPVLLEASGEQLLEARLACEACAHADGFRGDMLSGVARMITRLGF